MRADRPTNLFLFRPCSPAKPNAGRASLGKVCWVSRKGPSGRGFKSSTEPWQNDPKSKRLG
jgi:hypothetical protein